MGAAPKQRHANESHAAAYRHAGLVRKAPSALARRPSFKLACPSGGSLSRDTQPKRSFPVFFFCINGRRGGVYSARPAPTPASSRFPSWSAARSIERGTVLTHRQWPRPLYRRASRCWISAIRPQALLGRLGVPVLLRRGEGTFQANLGLMQRNSVAPADFHVGRFRFRFGKLVASVGDRPLGHGDHLVEPQSSSVGCAAPPFQGRYSGQGARAARRAGGRAAGRSR